MYMAYAKNKYSSKIHVVRTRASAATCQTPARKITLVVIIMAAVVVVVAIIWAVFFNPERIAKAQISSLANQYYEDFFYPNLAIEPDKMATVLAGYTGTGFAKVSLRQLILASSEDVTDELSQYCDDDSTYVQFFPIEPFGKTDYHVNYTYSCSF